MYCDTLPWCSPRPYPLLQNLAMLSKLNSNLFSYRHVATMADYKNVFLLCFVLRQFYVDQAVLEFLEIYLPLAPHVLKAGTGMESRALHVLGKGPTHELYHGLSYFSSEMVFGFVSELFEEGLSFFNPLMHFT